MFAFDYFPRQQLNHTTSTSTQSLLFPRTFRANHDDPRCRHAHLHLPSSQLSTSYLIKHQLGITRTGQRTHYSTNIYVDLSNLQKTRDLLGLVSVISFCRMATKEQFTVFIRLPFPRGEFQDPPPVSQLKEGFCSDF